jgi:hypothetical protein
MRQTGIKDKVLVRKTYFKCNKDASSTIIALMSNDSSDVAHSVPKPQTEIEKLRSILDEKEKLFQGQMQKIKEKALKQ